MENWHQHWANICDKDLVRGSQAHRVKQHKMPLPVKRKLLGKLD